ncbi:class I SAM-dependent methyltransferase [Methylobacterium brachiatum]|nr:class I SAM-dependent methyltransferase [Methylobacterium brachiatum]
MVNDYLSRLGGLKIDSLLEIGILRGGSVAFFNEQLKPKRHMAIDIHREEGGLDTLADKVNSGERGDRQLHVRYDISQSDTQGIVSEYERKFGVRAEFDLIIDDASHSYELSLETFNGLFPRVKPGGIYAIEDWGWGHWQEGGFQDPSNIEYNRPALSNLPLFCLMACTARQAGIARVDATSDTVFVHRNSQALPDNFKIEASFPTRGRQVALL